MKNLSELINENITEIEIEIETTPKKAKEIMNTLHDGEIKLNLDNLYCVKCSNEATLSGNKVIFKLSKGISKIQILGELML